MAGGNFGGGTGTELDPYLVEDADDINAVRNNLTAYYKQIVDIDLSGYINWDPIGNVDIGPPFQGWYDGYLFEIENLKVNSNASHIGLFSILYQATVKRIIVKNADIQGNAYQWGGMLTGGIVQSVVDGCRTEGSIYLTHDSGSAGGFTGFIEGGSTVDKCSVTGSVRAKIAGGFCPFISDPVSDCFMVGSVSGLSDTEPAYLGGFAYQAYSSAEIYSCFVAVSMLNCGDNSTIGGFAAYNSGSISSCYYDSDLSGHTDTGKGIPKTTVEMKQQATFAGWSFTDIWVVDEGQSYPSLKFPHKLTITISGIGTTDPVVGTYLHNEAEIVDLSAIAGTESRFVNWEGNVSNAKSANTTIAIGTTDETVIAVFMPGGFNANLAGIITKDIKPLTFKRASHTDSKQSADAVNDNFRQVSTYTGTVTKTLKQYNQNLGTLNGNIEEIRQILIDAGIIV